MDKNKKVEETKPEVVVEAKPKYRYFCDACTGIAFTANEIGEVPSKKICHACGRPLGVIKKENYIKNES